MTTRQPRDNKLSARRAPGRSPDPTSRPHRSRRAPSKTGRSVGRQLLRALGITVATIGLLLVGVWSVARVLSNTSSPHALAERCVASGDRGNWQLDTEQSANAAMIGVRAMVMHMPARAATIGLATAYQESKIRNITYGDRDSLGLFQQRPSQGWGTETQVTDPVFATKAFYRALKKVPDFQDMTVTQAAQAVQRSGFPEAYADHEDMGRVWAAALHGYSTASLTCVLDPVDSSTSVAKRTARLVKRISRDLPGLSATVGTGGDTVSLDIAAATSEYGLKPADQERVGWALAHWAVAVAADTETIQVTVGNNSWTRESGKWTPQRSTSTNVRSSGQVILTVAPQSSQQSR